MKLDDLYLLKDEEIDIDKYFEFYMDVRNNMKHPEWLGVIPKDEVIKILNNGGKLWIYKNDDDIVASIMYIPTKNESLKKHNIDYDASIVGSCGPTMVNQKYVGNGLMMQMLNVLNDYALNNNLEYMETKIHPDNIYSINNFLKEDYELVDSYISSDGPRNVYLKKY